VQNSQKPDIYDFPLYRRVQPGWDVFNYTDTWIGYVEAILADKDYTVAGAPKFQLAAYAQPIGFDANRGYWWDITSTLRTGILESSVGQYISKFALHMYFVRHDSLSWPFRSLTDFIHLLQGGNSPTNPAQPGSLFSRLNLRQNVTGLAEYAYIANQAGLLLEMVSLGVRTR